MRKELFLTWIINKQIIIATMTEINEFKKFAEHLASSSGDLIKKYFRTEISIETKSDNSPVTIADKGAEEIIREKNNV